VPLRLSQIPHDETRARTPVAAMGSQRLTSWAISLGLKLGNKMFQ
jgi:hypothetical protein